MSRNEARALIAQATGRDPDAVPADAAIETFDAWDSLSHMRLMLLLEDKLQRPLTSDEIVSVRSIEDVHLLSCRDGATGRP